MRADRMYTIRSPDKLKTLMIERGMTVRALAAEAKCSHSTIGHLRTGKTSDVSAAIAEDISSALDVTVNDLWFTTGRLAWCKR